jgi:VCBS repeat-containing protein
MTTITSSVTATLPANIDNLTLTGSADINGTGNTLNNVITGNSGNNVLDGGSGADTLVGGAGNDTYVVDNAGDVVVENPDEGTDTVQSSVSYTLSGNVENLVLTGAGAINGTGNALDNVITGNNGNNILNGLAGNDTLVGNSGSDILDGGSGADNMQGGSGDDTYVVDDAGDVVTETINAGNDTVQSGISYTLADTLENLTLTGSANLDGTGNALNNILIGNGGDNTLSAGAGNDTINGGLGADHMDGGLGDDTYVVDNVGDIVTEAAGSGIDTVQAGITYTLTDNVENLTLTGSANLDGSGNVLNNVINGTAGANALYGLDGDDTLNGNGGDDRLFGGNGNDLLDGGAGIDNMQGGTGDDTYIVDNVADVVVENGGEGTDVVQSSVNFTLGGNIENLVLTGAAAINGTGNAMDNVITGNNGSNVLSGMAGNDTLVGNAGNDVLDGGLGADNMQGGVGDDTYVVDDAGDIVNEVAGAGTDTVQSSIDYTLTATVENLTLTGAADLVGTGNALANIITGNSGNNTISADAGADTVFAGAGNDVVSGGDGNDLINGEAGDDRLFGDAGNDTINGGLGADQMTGGLGDDIYVVDNSGDIVIEAANEGIDLAQSSITYTLTSNVENLTLTGSADIAGTGNVLNNIINGNAGANVLDGLEGDDSLYGNAGGDTLLGGSGNDLLDGGVGADNMQGGLGDDTYVVDNVADLVTENAGEGTDTVQSGVTYILTGNVENLTLTGAAAINGSGNELDNVIVGNNGSNMLFGLAGNDTLIANAGSDTLDGGLGADNMQGGSGDDTYVVDDAGDVVTEGAGAGTDTVQSSITYTLTANVENLTLTGTEDLSGTGNALANIITGNSGNNTISADAGADTVFAGAGNDFIAGGDGNDLLNGEAGDDQLFGDTGNDTLNGGLGADQMAGGLGDDTYVVDNAGDIVTEDTAAGIDLVQSSVTYALTGNVENLTLTGTANIDGSGNALNNIINGNTGDNVLDGMAGDDTINANAGNDTVIGGDGNDVLNGDAGDDHLSGDAGNDLLNGGVGADAMQGGVGDDTYVVDNVADQVVENAGEGTDTVQAGVTYTLSDNVENLTLTGSTSINGSGNALDNVITGNNGNNSLFGMAGNDILVGSGGNDVLDGGLGADNMQGGLGDDTYVVDNAQDVVTEAAGSGTDTVQSSVSYTLGANLENLTLLGTDNLNGTGNALNNAIVGNAGANVIDGGAGTDTMSGGAGDDTYIVDAAADVIVEAAGAGTDIAYASVTYTLAANVENLVLTGAAAINGTGNVQDNIITGNGADNVLNGMAGNDRLLGGAGNDTLDGGQGVDSLEGGIGNDTYVVDNAADTVIENAGEGVDTVQASVGYTLAANLENLTLTGSANIDGTGNALDNVITGNGGNNVLNGMDGNDTLIGGAGNDTLAGGAGVDSLQGGAGDDTYIIDDADTIVEAAGAGIDTVQSSISHTLAANVENLVLTGTQDLNGTGNALNNAISGNAGANVLDGGAGADTLAGGAGDDTYIVDNTADVIVEAAGNGFDTVYASASYTLSANVEKLVLSGNANINGTGSTGDDTLVGNGGANVLDGGTGNDVLSGGAGNDSYLFQRGGGADRIIDSQGSDTLLLGAGITAADLHAEQHGNDVVLSVQGTTDSITLVDWLTQPEGISHIVFGDGTSIDIPGIKSLLNSAPTAVGDKLVVHEDSGVLAIPVTQLLANDTDPDAGDVLHVSSIGASAIGASVVWNGDTFKYDIGSRFQELAQGEVLKDSFTYTVVDKMGATSTAVVEVDIVGTNDAPVVALDTAAVTEDGAAKVSGNVLANDSDIDHGTVLQVAAPGTLAGIYGTLVIAQDGSYTYTLNNGAANVQALAQGQVVVDHFSYVATDGIVGVASGLDITVTGSYDAPLLSADAGQVIEDSQPTTSGNVLANDRNGDAGPLLKVVAPGTYTGSHGTLVLAQDGSYTYTLNNAAAGVQSLGQGQSVVDSFVYAATDGTASMDSVLEVTISGTNDAPVVTADTAAVTEDGAVKVSGNVLANDRDIDGGTVLQVAAPGTLAGIYGTLVIAQDGSYTYTLNNGAANVQALAQGQVVVDHFSYVATDGIVGVASGLDITVTGSYDAPLLSADAGQVIEDSQPTTSGNVLANDRNGDAGPLLKVVAPGTYTGSHGTLVLAQDGSYTYTLNNAAAGVQSLGQGQSVVDTFVYAATDGSASMDSVLAVTISGTNDAPVVTADTAHATYGTATTFSGNVLANDRDVDAGTVLKVATPGTFAGSYGKLAIAQDGSYTYTLDAKANLQSLGRGATVVEHFDYTATDGIAGVASSLDVTLSGANDAPILVTPLADQDLTFNKAFSFKVPANSFIDPDQGDTLTYSATLADGSALPSWLKFDAATGTFSGSTPKQVGSIDVRVTATDQVKATGSTAGSLSASDVFRLSVSHGNEGVGNGQDAAPPGHDTNVNDGPGTGPGNPGSKGAKVVSSARASNGIDIAAATAAAAPTAPAPAASAASDAGAAALAVPAYLNASQMSQYTTPDSNIGNTVSSQAFGNWLAVDLAVSATLAGMKSPQLAGEAAAADTSGLSKATAGFLGSTASIAADPLAHAAGAGQELQVFGGLGKGVAKIK